MAGQCGTQEWFEGPGVAEVVGYHDTRWDDRQAIVFLKTYDHLDGAYAFMNFIGGRGTNYYQITSDIAKQWLPAAHSSDGVGAAASSTDPIYLLDAPATSSSSGVAGRAADPPPTISLSALKTKLADLEAQASLGGTAEYRLCVEHYYYRLRLARYKRDSGIHEYPIRYIYGIESGQPRGIVLHRIPGLRGRSEENLGRYWFEGPDPGIVKFSSTDFTPDDDGVWFTQDIVTSRPLPAGSYEYYSNGMSPWEVDCNLYPEEERTHVHHRLTVTAPAGTVHEAFFDPVAIGDAVGSDGSNGVLESAAFALDGSTTTITSLKWENGAVTMGLSPAASLSGNIIDFIDVTGTTTLSLSLESAGTTTLVWSVPDKPWADGDLFMLRIGPAATTSVVTEVLEPPPAPGNLRAASTAAAVTLEWDAPDDPSVTGYQVLRRRPAAGEDTLLVYVEDTGNIETTYVDTGVDPGTAYVYRVKAINAAGAGQQSNYVNVTTALASAPAPGGLGVSLAGEAFGVTWSAVVGAAFYEVQQQVSGSADGWALVATTTGLSATYSPVGGTECGTTYEFRVRSYGDGTTYVAAWGAPSEPEPYTTEACNRPPEFTTSTYSFMVAEDATTTDPVGTVSATDPDSDPLSYAITAGNAAGKFDVGTNAGTITVAGALDHETVPSYTLTVEVRDNRDGVATTTVQITVTDVPEDTPPAPGGPGVSLTDDTFGVTWSAVVGAAFYEVQQQVSGSGHGWALVATTTGLSATYSPVGGAECGTTYEFRVRAYGDGATYVADWGEPSQPESYTTEVCNRVPTFRPSSHTLTIPENAGTSTSVGTISATDPDGDTVTYSITAGNDDGKFAIATSTGAITLTGTVDPDVVAFYALTVAAGDGVAGTSTAAVGVAVLLNECSNGTVVPRPRSNPRLVRDCSMLLAARDALAGDASLDWSADTRINDWQGLRVERGDSPYVRVLLLTGMGLTGRIPPEIGGIADLRRLDLDDNMLTGQIPRELGSLSDMVLMYLHINRLTGAIPAELGALSNLQTLNLSDNMLTGGIPAELGKLSNLRELLIEQNSLTGGIPAELGALSNLWSLYLSENMLTGGIPAELGKLSKLRYLVIERNPLGGEIPSQLGDLTRLEVVYLRNNGLTGTIPAEWGELPNLTYLYLSSGNSFTGCIPSGLRDVADNDLEGLGLDYCGSSAQ